MTGRGSVIMRAKSHVEELRKERERLIFTQIPYQVNKASLVEKIAPTWCARSASRASRICATNPTATACGSSSS